MGDILPQSLAIAFQQEFHASTGGKSLGLLGPAVRKFLQSGPRFSVNVPDKNKSKTVIVRLAGVAEIGGAAHLLRDAEGKSSCIASGADTVTWWPRTGRKHKRGGESNGDQPLLIFGRRGARHWEDENSPQRQNSLATMPNGRGGTGAGLPGNKIFPNKSSERENGKSSMYLRVWRPSVKLDDVCWRGQFTDRSRTPKAAIATEQQPEVRSHVHSTRLWRGACVWQNESALNRSENDQTNRTDAPWTRFSPGGYSPRHPIKRNTTQHPCL